MVLKSSGYHLEDGLDHRTFHRRMIMGPDSQFYSITMMYAKNGYAPFGEMESLTAIIFIALRYDLIGWLR